MFSTSASGALYELEKCTANQLACKPACPTKNVLCRAVLCCAKRCRGRRVGASPRHATLILQLSQCLIPTKASILNHRAPRQTWRRLLRPQKPRLRPPMRPSAPHLQTPCVTGCFATSLSPVRPRASRRRRRCLPHSSAVVFCFCDLAAEIMCRYTNLLSPQATWVKHSSCLSAAACTSAGWPLPAHATPAFQMACFLPASVSGLQSAALHTEACRWIPTGPLELQLRCGSSLWSGGHG